MRRIFTKIRVVYLLVSLLALVTVYWIFEQNNQSATKYRNEIIRLSQLYLQAIVKAQKNQLDDPYSSESTGYDLKKTLAVILDDLLRRIDNLEQIVYNSSANLNEHPNTRSEIYSVPGSMRALKMQSRTEAIVDHMDLLQNVQEYCAVQADDLIGFPECMLKIEWLRKHWIIHPCYRSLGVDGSECSFVRYLSEVEHFCPLLGSRKFIEEHRTAVINESFEGLLNLVSSNIHLPTSRKFVTDRLKRMWSDWLEGMKLYKNGVKYGFSVLGFNASCSKNDLACFSANKTNSFIGQPQLFGRKQLKILVICGLLTYDYFEKSLPKGGPLGELVQWTDLLAGLYLLGHDITLITDRKYYTSWCDHGQHNVCPKS